MAYFAFIFTDFGADITMPIIPALGLFDMIVTLLGGGVGGYAGFALTHLSILRKAARLPGKVLSRHRKELTDEEVRAAIQTRSSATSGSHVI